MNAVIATKRGMGARYAWCKGKGPNARAFSSAPFAGRAMAETDGKIETVLYRLFESIRTSWPRPRKVERKRTPVRGARVRKSARAAIKPVPQTAISAASYRFGDAAGSDFWYAMNAFDSIRRESSSVQAKCRNRDLKQRCQLYFIIYELYMN